MAELIKKLNPRNKKYTKKQIILMSVIVLVVVAVIGITYSFYAQRKTGWKQKYSVSGLTFTLNDRSSKSDALTYNCTIARGEERNIPLKLDTNGSALGTYGVDYTIKFALDGNDVDAAKVVEVYSLEDGKYVYKGMLDKLVSDNEMITGTMGIKDTVKYNYRLVYSQGAGESYEGKSFNLKITADYKINSDTDNYYVVTAADLEKVTTADVSGKTISLLGDVKLSKAISLDGKVGLNLNGHTLNLNGHNITINYSETGSSKLGLDGDNAKLIGGGKIIVDCADDVYRVDDSFKDCSRLEVRSFKVSSLASALQNNLTELGKSKHYNDDVIDFINGYRCYLNSSVATSGAMTIAKATGCGNVDVQTDGSYKIIAQTETFTDTYAFDVTANGDNVRISEDFSVIGTSVNSIADNLINAVPTTINSSVFLTTYDSKTKTNVTWVTSNSDYVTDEGIFLAHGKDSLDTWTNHKIKLGVICEKNGKTTYKSKTVTVVVLTPAERTELLFTYANMTISEVNGTVDISNETYMKLSEYQTKTGLSSYGIAVDATGTEKNVNYNGTDWYLTNNSDENNKVVKMAVKPTSASAVVVPATLTFTYSDYASPYTLSRNITAVGHTGDYTYVDYTNVIQADFIDPNLNKSAAGFKFWVNGTLPTGRLLDYEVGSKYTDSVKVTNGIFVPDNENGIFYYDTTDSLFHVATKTTSSELQRYSRKCLVEVLPAYVPYTGETASITAKSIESAVDNANVFTYSADTINKYGTGYYTTTENAENLVYEKQKGTDKNVEYPLTLAIDGIYHYNDYTSNGQSYTAEIPDYAMYKKLCTYFDTDNDGWISATEAKKAVSGTTNSEYSLSYVDLSNSEIKDITGLNYFTACTGFDLSGNSIVNLEPLSKISKLKYLDLSDNLVADITSLQYLDNLKYLDLSNASATNTNNITDVTPIKYLKNIEYLNLRYNNNLKDISALENYLNLDYINVYVDTSVNSELSSSTSNNAYVLALIYAHSKAKIYNASDTVVNPDISTVSAGNAALAVSKLVKLDETNNTLYFPENYAYGSSTYNFTYTTNSSNISFTPAVTTGSYPITTGYTITSPDVDTPVKIDVYVHSGTDTAVFSFCRSFTITLRQLKDENSQTYIQKTNGTVLAASLVVPDTSLRAKLFESFNSVTTGTVTIDSKEYSQSKIITQDEINSAGKELNYKDYGIKSLEGISNFSGTTSGKGITLLNLVGNPIESVENVNRTFPDISELSQLSNMKELYLGGQKYDFTMLSKYVQNDDTSTSGYYNVLAPTVTGLTGLTKLDVSGCYNLDDEKVQQSLYQVYLANVSCTVYKDSSSAKWNPYLIPLSEYSNSIPDEFVFEDLGDEANLFEDSNNVLRSNVVNIKESSSDTAKSYFYKFRFYNTMNIYFSFKKGSGSIKGNRESNVNSNSTYIAGTLSTTYSVSTSYSTTNSTSYIYAHGLGFDYSGINRGGTTNSLYSRDASAMVSTKLTGLENDNAGKIGRTTAITADHILHIKLEMNKKIKLKIGDMTEYKTLDEIFPGKTLRQKVSDYLCKTGSLKVNGNSVSNLYNYAMSADNPNHELDFTNSGNITDSNNNKITSIPVDSTIVIDGSYEADKGSAITGLKYTKCDSLYIYHDADLGDGSELVNLTSINFTLSSVDFSKITTSLPNLRNLYLGSFDSEGKAATNSCNASVIMYDTSYADTMKPYLDKLSLAADSKYTMTQRDWNRLRTIVRSKDENGKFNFYLNYMPALTSIKIQNSNVTDWRFTASMLFSSDTNNGSCDANSVGTLYFYNFSTSSTYNPNKYFNGKYCEPIVQQIYNKSTVLVSDKDYKIGAKADTVSNTTSDAVYTPDDFRKYLESHDSWLAADTTNSYENVITDTVESTKFSAAYTDLGMKIGSSYYSSLSSATANSTDTITLPAKTGAYMFGANLSDTAQTDINSVRNYDITWSVLNTDVTMTNTNGVVSLAYTGSANAANDNYVVFKAVISSVGKTLYFPVLIKGTGTVTGNVNPDNSYSFGKFSDPSLRFAMFINNGMTSTITTVQAAAVTTITYSNISKNDYANYCNGVLTLDGMEIFTNLKTLNMSGQFISDVSALNELVKLTSLNLSNNLVANVDLSALTKLTTLSLQQNVLKTIKSGSNCTLPTSLTNLNMSGNSLINADDIASLSSMSKLTTLNITNTRAADDPATLTALSSILSVNGGTLSFTAHTGTASSITAAAVSSYVSYINGGSSDTYFNYLVGGTANYANLNISNMTKTVAFVNKCVFSSDAVAQIADVLGLYSTGIRITDKDYSQLSVVKDVEIHFTKTNTLPIYCSADNVLINYSDLDPALYAYLVYHYTVEISGGSIGTYNNTSCFIITPSVTSISIGSTFTGIGIKSLKGLEKFPNLKTVSVYGADLTGLGFTGNLSNLTSLTLDHCVLISSAVADGIDKCISLVTLNMLKSSGIDFSENNLPTKFNSISSLKELSVNNVYNYANIYSTDISVNDASYADSSKLLFGSGRAISGYNNGKLGILTAYTDLNGSTKTKRYCGRNYLVANNLCYKMYTDPNNFSYQYINDDLYAMNKIYSVTKGQSNTLNSLLTTNENIIGFLNGTNQRLLSAGTNYNMYLYYDDFAKSTTGVKFYLPSDFNIMGQKASVTWTTTANGTSMANNASDLLTQAETGGQYTFAINSNVVNAANLKNDNLITLKAVITYSGKSMNRNYTIHIVRNVDSTSWSDENVTSTVNTAGDYYIEDENGRIVPANTYFRSAKLVDYIFNSAIGTASNMSNSSGTKISLSTETSSMIDYVEGRKYLSYKSILSVSKFKIAATDGGLITVTNLDGIQIFRNLKDLSVGSGYINSIEPLSQLKLESFTYANGDSKNTGVDTSINDWTPLYNSRNTLKTFSYGTNKFIQYDNLSFLMQYPSLTSVTIGKSGGTVGADKIQGFRYMLEWMAKYRSSLTLTFNGTTILNSGSVDESENLSTDFKAAENVLEKFTATAESGITYENNFEIGLKDGKSKGEEIVLPSYIDVGGKKYPIEWQSGSSDITVLTPTLANGSTEDDYFVDGLSWKMKISTSSEGMGNLVARIKIGNYIYERVFGVNCNKDNVYPSAYMNDGFGRVVLVGTWTSADSTAYELTTTTVDSNTYTILTLKNAVSGTVYVNNPEGDKVPLYCNWSSESISKVANFITEIGKWTSGTYSVSTIVNNDANAKKVLSLYSKMTTGEKNYYFATTSSAKTEHDMLETIRAALKSEAFVENEVSEYYDRMVSAFGTVNGLEAKYNSIISEIEAGTQVKTTAVYKSQLKEYVKTTLGITNENFTITYHCDVTFTNASTNKETFNPFDEDEFELVAPSSLSSGTYEGWYTDAAHTTSITTINYAAFNGSNSLDVYLNTMSYYIKVNDVKVANFADFASGSEAASSVSNYYSSVAGVQTAMHINIHAGDEVKLCSSVGGETVIETGTAPITAAYNFYYGNGNSPTTDAIQYNNLGFITMKAEYYTVSGNFDGCNVGVANNFTVDYVNNNGKGTENPRFATNTGYFGYMYDSNMGYYLSLDVYGTSKERDFATWYTYMNNNSQINMHTNANYEINPWANKTYVMVFDPLGQKDEDTTFTSLKISGNSFALSGNEVSGYIKRYNGPEKYFIDHNTTLADKTKGLVDLYAGTAYANLFKDVTATD